MNLIISISSICQSNLGTTGIHVDTIFAIINFIPMKPILRLPIRELMQQDKRKCP